jgi:hypothetical protein
MSFVIEIASQLHTRDRPWESHVACAKRRDALRVDLAHQLH